jgi:hypothetical protein
VGVRYDSTASVGEKQPRFPFHKKQLKTWPYRIRARKSPRARFHSLSLPPTPNNLRRSAILKADSGTSGIDKNREKETLSEGDLDNIGSVFFAIWKRFKQNSIYPPCSTTILKMTNGCLTLCLKIRLANIKEGMSPPKKGRTCRLEVL